MHALTDTTKRTGLNPKMYKKGNTLVSYKVYRLIMGIWGAFSATDINNDHSLNSKELRMLL